MFKVGTTLVFCNIEEEHIRSARERQATQEGNPKPKREHFPLLVL
jgi:hypothetical protein